MKKYITAERIIYVLVIIMLVLIFHNCSHQDVITKVIPEYIKTTDTITFNHIQEKKIYIKGKMIRVDSLRYVYFKQEVDSCKKDSAFIDAVTIRSYDSIIEDNDRIKLEVNSKVDGRLINLSAKYTIKEQKVEPIVRRPNVSLILGGGLNISGGPFLSTGLQFRDGIIMQATIDNHSNYSVGLAKTFTILK